MCVAPTCPFSSSALRDRHADHVDFARDHVRRFDADRLRERRQPDARRERARLMVHVDDLRLPLPPRVLDDARLDHVQHVRVAVVVVADVLLIQLRQARQLVRRADVLHVPLGHHLLAVGIDRRPEHQDDVVEDRLGLRLRRRAEQIVREQRRVLRAGDLGRVQPAVDVHERLAVARQASAPRPRSDRRGCASRCHDLAVAIDLRAGSPASRSARSTSSGPATSCPPRTA